MTTITTWTSGPKVWKIALVAGAVGLATIVVTNLPLTNDTGQQLAQTATATSPESVTGFEYGNESTAGQVASPGVTTQYLGKSGELFPYENGPAPVQAPTGFGGPTPQATLNQAEINRLAPVITHEFLDGPSSATQGATHVDPRAAAAVGLNPGAINAIVGNTEVAAPPVIDLDQMIADEIAAREAARAT